MRSGRQIDSAPGVGLDAGDGVLNAGGGGGGISGGDSGGVLGILGGLSSGVTPSLNAVRKLHGLEILHIL